MFIMKNFILEYGQNDVVIKCDWKDGCDVCSQIMVSRRCVGIRESI